MEEEDGYEEMKTMDNNTAKKRNDKKWEGENDEKTQNNEPMEK